MTNFGLRSFNSAQADTNPLDAYHHDVSETGPYDFERRVADTAPLVS